MIESDHIVRERLSDQATSARWVLQWGSIAGWPYQYARALEQAGLPSKNVVPTYHEYGSLNRSLPIDRILCPPDQSLLVSIAKRTSFFFREVVPRCSLVHYHGGSILPRSIDHNILRSIGRPMLATFAGTDVRLESVARQKNPYIYIPPYTEGEDNIRRKLERAGRLIRFAATDFELGEYAHEFFERVFYLPQPINLPRYRHSPPSAECDTPVVIHIPTNREAKGTEYIEAAAERLIDQGYRFEFRLIEPKLTQEQVIDEIQKADVVIDAICTGAYGMFALEAMACGKPTVCYIREDLADKHPPDLPILSANPDTVFDVLKSIVADGQLRHEVGQRSRKFVADYHALEVVGPVLRGIYEEIGLLA